jgi:uncharacterized protein
VSLPDPRTLPAYLHEAGIDLTPAELADALRALAAWPGSLDAEEAMRRLRIVLSRDSESWRVLPALVRAWRRGEAIEHVAGPDGAGRGRPRRRGLESGGEDRASATAGEGRSAEGEGAPGPDAVEEARAGDSPGGLHAARGASEGRHGEAARPDSGRRLAEAVERYRRATAPRPRRRRAPAWRGRIALGATWRESLRTQGEPLRLLHAARPTPPAHRVFLVDTSASMQAEDGFAATLAEALAAGPVGTEVRAFDVDLLPGRWPQAARPVGGGTRIGPSLVRYLRGSGRRLGPQSHVMIWSDGWETGEIAVLERALAALVRRAGRVDWLCPIAATEGFRPTCRGLVAALAQGITVYDVHDESTFARYVDRLEAVDGGARGRDGAQGGDGLWAS